MLFTFLCASSLAFPTHSVTKMGENAKLGEGNALYPLSQNRSRLRLCNVIPNFKPVDETLVCDRSFTPICTGD